ESGEAGVPGEASGSPGGAYKPASTEGPAENVPVPERPLNARGDSERAAVATASYFWDTLYYLQRTGDPEPMNEVVLDQCQACDNWTEYFTWIYDQGGWETGERPKVSAATVGRASDGSEGIMVYMVVQHSASVGYDQYGIEVERDSSEPFTRAAWDVLTTWDSEQAQWLISSVEMNG
ncbi:MAG: DUF6318 family protein, partial [Micrococcus sp.]|nr:DUF6318 family protein [Micrococcus sp.]